MYWPERVVGKRVGAESVLVAHHHQLEVEAAGYESEIAYHAVDKFQLLKRVYLLVGRLFDECAVTVDE